MKHQALFPSKDKSKKLKCRLLQFLCGALRANSNVSSSSTVAQYIVRLVTYIKGTTYVNTPYVPGTFVNVGKFLGRFHQASEVGCSVKR